MKEEKDESTSSNVSTDEEKKTKSARCGRSLAHFRTFYSSTNSKYVLHMVFSGIYVAVFAYSIIDLSTKSIRKPGYTDFGWSVYMVALWQLSFLVEMGIGCMTKGIDWMFKHEVDFYRNLIVLVTATSFLMAALCTRLNSTAGAFFVALMDTSFYLSFIFAAVRSMKILKYDSFFGSIVLMMKKMIPPFLKCFLILIIFWFTYAVCHVSASGQFSQSNQKVRYASDPIWQIFRNGAFEIFGEAEDKDKDGSVNCSPFSWGNLTDSAVHCAFRSWTVSVLLFAYMLVVAIVVVNLITALLTTKYDDVSKYANIYWKSKLYDRLIEYEEKLWWPPPLNLIYFFLVLIRVLLCFDRCLPTGMATWMKHHLYTKQYPLINGLENTKDDDDAIRILQTRRNAWVQEELDFPLDELAKKLIKYVKKEFGSRSRAPSGIF